MQLIKYFLMFFNLNRNVSLNILGNFFRMITLYLGSWIISLYLLKEYGNELKADILIIGTLVFLCSTIISGYFLDRYCKKKLIIVFGIITSISYIILYFLEVNKLNFFYIVCLSVSLIQLSRSVIVNSFLALTPKLFVHKNDSVLSITALRTSLNYLAKIISLFVGGVLAKMNFIDITFISLSIISFLSIIPYFFINYNESLVKVKRSVKKEYFIIFSFLKKNHLILVVFLLDFFVVVFSSFDFKDFFSKIRYFDEMKLSYLYISMTIGSIIIGFILIRVKTSKRAGIVFIFSTLVYSCIVLIMLTVFDFYGLILCFLILGAADATNSIIRHSYVQEFVPEHYIGRMSTVNTFFSNTSDDIGDVKYNYMSNSLGRKKTVFLGGLISLIIISFVYLKGGVRKIKW